MVKLVRSCQNKITGVTRKMPEAESMYLRATVGKEKSEHMRKIVNQSSLSLMQNTHFTGTGLVEFQPIRKQTSQEVYELYVAHRLVFEKVSCSDWRKYTKKNKKSVAFLSHVLGLPHVQSCNDARQLFAIGLSLLV